MKVGFRTPNVKSRVKARTTGKIKRSAKRAVNPFYGQKGAGFVKSPKKSIYNSVYHQTTFSPIPGLRSSAANKQSIYQDVTISEKDAEFMSECYPEITNKISEHDYVEDAVVVAMTPFAHDPKISTEQYEEIHKKMVEEKKKEFRALKKKRKKDLKLSKITLFFSLVFLAICLALKDFWIAAIFGVLLIFSVINIIKYSK